MAVIYDVTCSNCGASLKITKMKLDADNDLRIEVQFCDDCSQREYERGLEAGKQEKE